MSLAAIGVLSLVIGNAPPVTTAFAVYVGLFVAVGLPALTTTSSLLTLVQTHAAPAVRGRARPLARAPAAAARGRSAGAGRAVDGAAA